jgi:hypothetical protein
MGGVLADDVNQIQVGLEGASDGKSEFDGCEERMSFGLVEDFDRVALEDHALDDIECLDPS